MKPIFHSNRPIWAPGAALGPETAVFRLETAPPFGAGAALDAAGAAIRPAGAALAVPGAEFRRAGAVLAVPGADFRRPGASLDGAGATLRRSGAAPIFTTEAPAACSDATIFRSGHPGGETERLGDKETARLCLSESSGFRFSTPRGKAALLFSKSPPLQVFCQ